MAADEARKARAAGALRVPDRNARQRGRHGPGCGRTDDRHDHDAADERRHGPRRGLRRRPPRRSPRPSAPASPTISATPMRSRTRCAAGLRPAGRPRVPRWSAAGRPGPRPRPRRPLAVDGRHRPGVPAGHQARPRHLAAVRRRPPATASRSWRRTGSRSACWSGPSRAIPSGPGSSSAARPASRATGSPSTAWPTRTASGIAAEVYRWAELEQLVFSPSRWERRLVGSTIATMTHGKGRSGRAADGRRACPAAAGAADGRCGTRRPEGAVVGLSLAGPGRSGGHRRPPCGTRRTWPPRTTTAIGRGSSATACPSSIPTTADDLRARLAGIRKRPGAPSTSTAAAVAARSAACPIPSTTLNRRSSEQE